MKVFFQMVKRNIKLYFKDKGMFFVSLITPAILLVLYSTFLAKVYRDSFTSNLPQGFEVSEKVINGLVGGELASSLLAVCCVTVAFCANFVCVRDKATGVRMDLTVSPVKPHVLAAAYFAANVLTTLIVCFAATSLCLIYIACVGWFFSFADVILLFLDVILAVLFGASLSSVINFFLSTEGQMSAVGTIVSAGYGFVCGAYMPLSQFSQGLRNALGFLPGTYATSLIRNHAMGGALKEMLRVGFPEEVVEAIRDSVDCNLYFFENSVSVGAMYGIVCGAVALLVVLYVLINVLAAKKR